MFLTVICDLCALNAIARLRALKGAIAQFIYFAANTDMSLTCLLTTGVKDNAVKKNIVNGNATNSDEVDELS